MASSSKVLLLPIPLLCFCLVSISAYEFQVGDRYGWRVPPKNDTKVYNDWASINRFKVGDSLRFQYRKDSVMRVDEADYKQCNSSRPMLFSNTGNTIYKLDRSGPFFFISGASGHCQKGQGMIVKVMHDDNDDGHKSNGHKLLGYSNAVVLSCAVITQLFLPYLF